MNSAVNELEQQMVEAKAAIDKRNMALKLANNREFKKLILEGFCEAEAARSIRLSVAPEMDEASRKDAVAAAQAAGYLKRYLSAIMAFGNNAERAIAEIEEAIAEARAEEFEEAAGEVETYN